MLTPTLLIIPEVRLLGVKVVSFLFPHPTSIRHFFYSTLSHIQNKSCFHLHRIHATIIYYSDRCINLLTSPSFYPSILHCIFNTAIRTTFNFIQVTHSSDQDPPPMILYFTMSESQSPYPWASNDSTVCCSSHSLNSSSLLPLLSLFQYFHLFVIPRTYQFL